MLFRAFLCRNGIFTGEHLHKGVTLVFVNDAGLHDAVAAEDVAELRLRATTLEVSLGFVVGNNQLTLRLQQRAFDSGP